MRWSLAERPTRMRHICGQMGGESRMPFRYLQIPPRYPHDTLHRLALLEGATASPLSSAG